MGYMMDTDKFHGKTGIIIKGNLRKIRRKVLESIDLRMGMST